MKKFERNKKHPLEYILSQYTLMKTINLEFKDVFNLFLAMPTKVNFTINMFEIYIIQKEILNTYLITNSNSVYIWFSKKNLSKLILLLHSFLNVNLTSEKKNTLSNIFNNKIYLDFNHDILDFKDEDFLIKEDYLKMMTIIFKILKQSYIKNFNVYFITNILKDYSEERYINKFVDELKIFTNNNLIKTEIIYR